jgi:hypothetical protein
MLLSSAETPITVLGVGLGSLAIGGLLLKDGLKSLNESLERQRGPSARGWIISSRLVGRDTPAEDGTYSRTWHLDVVYEYPVRGRLYSGTRITAEPLSFNSWLYAAWKARRYRSGAEVRVYFDSTAPDRAILDPRLTVWSTWFYLLAGSSCAVAGIMALARVAGLGRR